MQAFHYRVAVVLLGGVLAFSPVWAAQWKEVFRQQGEVRYLDTASIKHEGHTFSIWELDDYAKARANAPGSKAAYKSRVYQSVGNCQTKSIRSVKMYFYEKGMATGNVVYTLTFPPSPDEEAPPGSIGRDLIDYFCAKPRK